MITVTRLNMQEVVINAELIEMIEETPDTVITMTTGRKVVVKETKQEMIDKIIMYKQRIMSSIQF